jgi:hypothetical protein
MTTVDQPQPVTHLILTQTDRTYVVILLHQAFDAFGARSIGGVAVDGCDESGTATATATYTSASAVGGDAGSSVDSTPHNEG